MRWRSNPFLPSPILAIRETVPTMEALVDLLSETHPYARQKENTNLLAVFHGEGYEREAVDVEVGFPIDAGSRKPIPLVNGRMLQPTVLPGSDLLAYTVHKGGMADTLERLCASGALDRQQRLRDCGAGARDIPLHRLGQPPEKHCYRIAVPGCQTAGLMGVAIY